MRFLIDTSSFFTTLVLFDELKIIDKIEVENSNKTSESIFLLMDELFKKNNLKYSDLKEIYTSIGPGSFTGIRVGLTIAKTLAVFSKIPLYSYNSLEYMVSGYEIPVTAAIEDRNDHYYFAKYDKLKEVIKPQYNLLDTTEFVSYKGGNLPPRVDILKLSSYLRENQNGNPNIVVPLYIKKLDVEK